MAPARLLGAILLPNEARSEEHGLHPSLLERGVSSRAVEECHPCRFILHRKGRREGGGRGIPLLFWGEEVYSTMPSSLLFLRSGGSPYVYLSEVGGGRATSFSRY